MSSDRANPTERESATGRKRSLAGIVSGADWFLHHNSGDPAVTYGRCFFGRQFLSFKLVVAIAANARERQIVEEAGAAVLLGNDVLGLQTSHWRVVLRQPAVFAAVIRSLANLSASLFVHQQLA